MYKRQVVVQDFPIRGKKLFLNVRRRRWVVKDENLSLIHICFGKFIRLLQIFIHQMMHKLFPFRCYSLVKEKLRIKLGQRLSLIHI